MLFRAENLGPIRSAELDLSKKLIVLAGPNNSGKTYLGWALYGLSRFNPGPLPSVSALMALPLDGPDHQPLEERIRPHLASFLAELAHAYSVGVYRDFAATREPFLHTRLRITSSTDQTLAAEFMAEALRNISSLPDHGVIRERGVSNSIRFRFLGHWRLFPVERLAINIFARELSLIRMNVVDELTDDPENALTAESLRKVGRYPLAIRDALRVAADLETYKRETSPFADLADELETSVLGGRVVLTDTGEMAFRPGSSPDAPSLGVHRSSSIIKSLASIVVYLRHIARDGDQIIIDEPELNLHPDNQRRVARVLAKIANRGIRVLLSTHSDTLIGEFNNLIMLSHGSDPAATESLMQELGYDAASVLRPEDLGVYLVSDGECKPVPVAATGFEVRTIDEAIHKLNQDAQKIYGRLFCE
ncbi:MAG: ATP-binding protein [Myxococcales bacterium]|nr:ATP-binding protein [Myxococcales bacterium]